MDVREAVVVVTGSSSGIGRATALAFASRGSIVVGAARRKELLDELTGLIEGNGGRALAVRCDVTDMPQVEALRDRVRETFGRCDVLINNAGIAGGAFHSMSTGQIERLVHVNLLGVLYCTKAFLPMMLEARRGHVVNVASVAGRVATPGASVYAATKHAVVAFSEALHFEVRHRGLRVTTVNPGFVETEGFPHRERRSTGGLRVMQPDAVADLIVKVVQRDLAPERSIPRWLAAVQAVRVLAPPLYRAGLGRIARLRGGPEGPRQGTAG